MSNSSMDVLDEIDYQWRNGKRPDLKRLVGELINNGETELCVEACAADLEWQWRSQSGNSGPATRESRHPVAADYSGILGSIFAIPKHFQRLVEAEFLARSQWGDQPDVDQFAVDRQACFASEFTEASEAIPKAQVFRQHLANQLEHLAHFQLIVTGDNESLLHVRVPAEFEIGRQSQREPAPPAWIKETSRLIIAVREDKKISRHQIHIRRTRIHEVELINTSRNVALALKNGPLLPGSAARLATPISININDYCVTVNTET